MLPLELPAAPVGPSSFPPELPGSLDAEVVRSGTPVAKEFEQLAASMAATSAALTPRPHRDVGGDADVVRIEDHGRGQCRRARREPRRRRPGCSKLIGRGRQHDDLEVAAVRLELLPPRSRTRGRRP